MTQCFHVDELRLVIAAVAHGILNKTQNLKKCSGGSVRRVFLILCLGVLVSFDRGLAKSSLNPLIVGTGQVRFGNFFLGNYPLTVLGFKVNCFPIQVAYCVSVRFGLLYRRLESGAFLRSSSDRLGSLLSRFLRISIGCFPLAMMACLPGFPQPGTALFNNCTVTFGVLYPQSYVAMRTIPIVVGVLGLAFASFIIFDHRKARQGLKSAEAAGAILVWISFLSILLFYAIDPGTLQAKQNGYWSESYERGFLTFIFSGSALSATASSFLAAFWVSLLEVGEEKVFLNLGLRATLVWVFAAVYFVIIGTLNIALPAGIDGASNVQHLLRGLLTMGTLAISLVAGIAGWIVLTRLKRAEKFREFGDEDRAQIRRVTIHLVVFVGAQFLCTTGEFVVVFFPEQTIAAGPIYLWLGVFYPGILFLLAFFFILLALKRKQTNMRSGHDKTDVPLTSKDVHTPRID